MELMQRRRQLLAMHENGIPVEYRPVAYLESSGNQYIDTDIPPNVGFGMEVKYAFTTLINIQYVLGLYVSGVVRISPVFCDSINDAGFSLFTTGLKFSPMRYGTIDYGTHIVKFNNPVGHVYYDGNLVYHGAIQGIINRKEPVYLFCRNNGGPSNYYKGKMYYTAFYNQNGSKIFYGLPCVRKSDNKPGIYDTVSKTFYTNAGTGEFIVPN